jgi:hypothetical protein
MTAPRSSEENTWETVTKDHPTAWQCTSTCRNLAKMTMTTVGWKIMKNAPYSLEIVTTNFVWANEGAPKGQDFQIDDELKCNALN